MVRTFQIERMPCSKAQRHENVYSTETWSEYDDVCAAGH